MSRHKLPGTYRRASIVSGIACALGAGVGGYLSSFKGNYLFAGIGAAAGTLLGYIVGVLLTTQQLPLATLEKYQSKLNTFYASLALFFAISGLVVFLIKGEWIGIVGALFFGCIAVYFYSGEGKS